MKTTIIGSGKDQKSEKPEAIEKKDNKVAINAAAQKQMDEQKAIEEAQKVLNAQIDKFNKKNQLIADRNKFLKNKEKLNNSINSIGSDYDETLDQKNLRIVLAEGDYDRDKILSISNTLIVREFIDFVSRKIDIKIAEIEKEILAS